MLVRDIDQLNVLAKPLFEQYKVSHAAIFGSFSRGDVKKKSDIDLLDIVGLKQDLEEVFGRKVDLLTYASLSNNEFSQAILQEAKTIYEKNQNNPTAHKYKQLDMEAVWIVAQNRIPEILSFIDTLIQNETTENSSSEQ